MGSEGWQRARGRLAVGLCTTGILLALTAPPAFAATFERCTPAGCVKGTITVSNNRTSWDLQVIDNRADGLCVYGKVRIDVGDGIDTEFRSENSCPRGEVIPFADSDAYADTRGTAIHVCTSNGQCREVYYQASN